MLSLRTRGVGAIARGAVAALAFAAGAVIALAVGVAPAAASQGSVPSVVASFTTEPSGLLAQLRDLFGPGANGKTGIAFDATTKVGQLNRIFTLSHDFVAGTSADNPLEWQNLWAAPISLGDTPVGLAVIGIDPNSDAPTLASFSPEPALAKILSDVGADLYLVHDVPRGAWLTLSDSTFTTLFPGTSGASGQVSLGAYQRLILETAAQNNTATQVPTLAVLVLIVLVGGLALLIWLPGRRARSIAASRDAAAPALEPDAGTLSVPDPTQGPPSKAALAKPPAVTRPPSPITKAPAATAPLARPASTKPPVSKPPVSKPPVTKAPVTKPPASNPRPTTPDGESPPPLSE